LLPLAGEQVTDALPQLSVPLAEKVTLLLQVPAPAATVMFAGQVIAGASVSLTVTVKVQALVLPLVSVAVQVTVVAPSAKGLPLAGTHAEVTPGQLSDAVAVKMTLLVQLPGAVLTVLFAGQVMLGACVSLTVTVNVQAFVLPLVSVAVQ